jgi:hypothetical protein
MLILLIAAALAADAAMYARLRRHDTLALMAAVTPQLSATAAHAVFADASIRRAVAMPRRRFRLLCAAAPQSCTAPCAIQRQRAAAGLPPPFFITPFRCRQIFRAAISPPRRRRRRRIRAAPRCCRRQRCHLLRAALIFSPIAADTPMLSATTPCRDARFRRYAASAAAAMALPPCRRERQRRRYFCRTKCARCICACAMMMRSGDAAAGAAVTPRALDAFHYAFYADFPFDAFEHYSPARRAAAPYAYAPCLPPRHDFAMPRGARFARRHSHAVYARTFYAAAAADFLSLSPVSYAAIFAAIAAFAILFHAVVYYADFRCRLIADLLMPFQIISIFSFFLQDCRFSLMISLYAG